MARRALPVAGLTVLAALAAGCSLSDGLPAPSTTTSAPAASSSSPGAPDASGPAGSSASPSGTATGPAPSSVAPAGAHADPAALDVVVNKARPLSPVDWAPQDLVPVPGSDLPLRAEAASAAGGLLEAAAAAGHELVTLSAHRSHAYQVRTYGHWVAELGRAEADRVSARPGHSEHQTGLAWDVGDAAAPSCDLEACFGDTAAGRWVAGHAAEHGFVVRYPAGAEPVTGFAHEPWHLRYVGPAAAGRIEAAGGVLETAWGLPAAPDYTG